MTSAMDRESMGFLIGRMGLFYGLNNVFLAKKQYVSLYQTKCFIILKHFVWQGETTGQKGRVNQKISMYCP